MEQQEAIVAVSMLTQREVDAIGHQLNLIYRLDSTTQFDALLAAIDEATQGTSRHTMSMMLKSHEQGSKPM